MADKFPVEMHHPKTGGTTRAASKSSLKVLEKNGWKRGPKPQTAKSDAKQ